MNFCTIDSEIDKFLLSKAAKNKAIITKSGINLKNHKIKYLNITCDGRVSSGDKRLRSSPVIVWIRIGPLVAAEAIIPSSAQTEASVISELCPTRVARGDGLS